MDKVIQDRINEWLGPDYDAGTRKEIQDLVGAKNEKELTDRFYTELEFGTAGLRGTLGAGTNRMNIYNVRKATQGLANTIIKKGGEARGVLIGRDPRILSDVFSLEAASVFLANGIKVFYFDDIHPTPTVSFGLQHLKAISGVMITASHNPKEYNGYKVLWEDGAQITPPYDDEIIEEVRKITTLKQVKTIPTGDVKKHPMFSVADSIVDPVYLAKVRELSIHPDVCGAGLKICYSPLYGTGYKMVPAGLKNLGFTDLVIVEEQARPDGNFPTAPYPNPEEKEAMKLGMDYAARASADLFVATDPDADRIGVVLKKGANDYVLLNGNQIAALLAHYISTELKNTGRMPSNPRIIKTIVTTDLITAIAGDSGVGVDEVLTGFKWIGNKMNEYDREGPSSRPHFIFGCEESHGYLSGTFVRDKDAVIGTAMFAELAAFYRSRGTSAYQVLEGIYRKHGYYCESQRSFTMKGQDGAHKIQALMDRLRNDPPRSIAGLEVLKKVDLMSGEVFDMKSGRPAGKWDLPQSNVIVFNMAGGAKIIGRPSGTEPKIKFYFTASGKPAAGESTIDQLTVRVNQEHDAMVADFVRIAGLQ